MFRRFSSCLTGFLSHNLQPLYYITTYLCLGNTNSLNGYISVSIPILHFSWKFRGANHLQFCVFILIADFLAFWTNYSFPPKNCFHEIHTFYLFSSFWDEIFCFHIVIPRHSKFYTMIFSYQIQDLSYFVWILAKNR